MFSVLLVDDEHEVRSGLKLKIDWEANRFKVTGEAQDGREALALLERERFDLILTDIRMPIMSGLELLQQCAENYPDVKVVVLSGHDDFHYVKSAMQCGARDYLLKPVVRRELTNILRKLQEELESEKIDLVRNQKIQNQLRKSYPLLQEQLLLEFIGGDDETASPGLQSEIHRLDMGRWLNDSLEVRFVSVELRIPADRPGELAEGDGLFRSAFQLVCRETAEDPSWEGAVYAFHHRSYPRMMHFIVSSTGKEEEEARLRELCERIHGHIRRYLKAESVIGIGNPVRGLNRLRSGFNSSLIAWSGSRPGALSQTITPAHSVDSLPESFPEIEKRLTLAIENGDRGLFLSTLEKVFHSGETRMQGAASFILRVILLLDQVAGKYRLDIPETRQWMFPDTLWRHRPESSALPHLTDIAARIMEGIRHSRVTGGVEVVEAVRRHIDDCYMNELGLTILAERFHINPTYLSELFKKHTGTTFSDYVTQVRIGRAAELLADANMRLSDIAELVGFANSSYLSSVFKKYYGVSPNAYRLQPISRPTEDFRCEQPK